MRNLVEILASTSPATAIGSSLVLNLNDVLQENETRIDELFKDRVGNGDKVSMFSGITDQNRATLVFLEYAIALRCYLAHGLKIILEG